MPLDHQTYVKLNNGTLVPQFGMGVYSIPEGGHSADSVREAVRLGYRHFDMSHAGSLEKTAVEALLDRGKHVLTSDKRSLEAPVIHHQSFK